MFITTTSEYAEPFSVPLSDMLIFKLTAVLFESP